MSDHFRWKKSQEIRAYLNAAREMDIKRDGSISPGGKIDTWLKWGERYADKMAPLV
ncbi:MAG: hypothetical protein HYR80_08000 [Nitrospirae bacterium]|nr:hypothetical protein [Nitrospirota bacterium]